MLPDRVAVLIIKDKKLLLVTGYEENFYGILAERWRRRELFSELNIKVTSFKHYLTIMLLNQIIAYIF